MNLGELGRLSKVDAESILSEEIEPLGTEYEVVKDLLNAWATVRFGERDVKLPGFARHIDLMIAALAEYKSKKKRNVRPYPFAKSDDIVIMPLRPQHFGIQIYKKSVTLDTDKYTKIDDIIPQTTGKFSVPSEQVFIITDFVDIEPDSPVQAIQVVDVDGDDWHAISTIKELRVSDLHIIELDYPIIADKSLNIDALVASETAGDTVTHELVPFGVWIGFGSDVPELRTET